MFESITGNGNGNYSVHERLDGSGELCTMSDYAKYCDERSEQLKRLIAESEAWEAEKFTPAVKLLNKIGDQIGKTDPRRLYMEREKERQLWAKNPGKLTEEMQKETAFWVDYKTAELQNIAAKELQRVYLGNVMIELRQQKESYAAKIAELSKPISETAFRVMVESAAGMRFRRGVISAEELHESKIRNAERW